MEYFLIDLKGGIVFSGTIDECYDECQKRTGVSKKLISNGWQIIDENKREEKKAQWLKENDYQDGDVMTEKNGREYVIEEIEVGHPSEAGCFNSNKLYLEYILI